MILFKNKNVIINFFKNLKFLFKTFSFLRFETLNQFKISIFLFKGKK